MHFQTDNDFEQNAHCLAGYRRIIILKRDKKNLMAIAFYNARDGVSSLIIQLSCLLIVCKYFFIVIHFIVNGHIITFLIIFVDNITALNCYNRYGIWHLNLTEMKNSTFYILYSVKILYSLSLDFILFQNRKTYLCVLMYI